MSSQSCGIDSREKNWTFFIAYTMTVISGSSPRARVERRRIRRRFLRFIAKVRRGGCAEREGSIVPRPFDTITNSTPLPLLKRNASRGRGCPRERAYRYPATSTTEKRKCRKAEEQQRGRRASVNLGQIESSRGGLTFNLSSRSFPVRLLGAASVSPVRR